MKSRRKFTTAWYKEKQNPAVGWETYLDFKETRLADAVVHRDSQCWAYSEPVFHIFQRCRTHSGEHVVLGVWEILRASEEDPALEIGNYRYS
jgi:hypothetical protein